MKKGALKRVIKNSEKLRREGNKELIKEKKKRINDLRVSINSRHQQSAHM